MADASMIKFFRKIRQQLIQENKMSKYFKYAIGEILLVMVGILLALQVNNWNEERKDRIKEKAILAELHKDFNKNLNEFVPVKQNQVNTLNSGNIVFRNLDHMGNTVSRDSVYKYIMGMFGGYPYYPSNGVVESLISSGDFNLIRNDSLRKYLVSWKDVLNNYTEFVDIDRNFWSSTIEPYVIQNGNFVQMQSPENLRLIQDQTFLNMMKRKQHFQENIINAIKGDNGIEHYLVEIVRLSKTSSDD